MSQAPVRKRSSLESVRFRALAKAFAERVLGELDGAIQAVVLYGSVARGEATPESDVDLFIVTPQPQGIWSAVGDIAHNISAQHGYRPSLVPYAVDVRHIEDLVRLGSPYLRDVLNEGRILYDDGTFAKLRQEILSAPYWRYMTAAHPPEFARDTLLQADEMLEQARLLLQHGHLRGVADRAYYAMFHAATAAVSQEVPRLPRTHDGLKTLFSLHFVATGRVARDAGSDLDDALRLRLAATYNPRAALDADAVVTLVEKAAAFIAAVRQLLGMEEPS
ncbi:MAG: nucleotidyltransferase domain-containing protein [Chloroflexi bacterium]|nr:nucleotidyltransferase domain-containing protein [Chloroflexota bacterium]